jgi:hypothetical protein
MRTVRYIRAGALLAGGVAAGVAIVISCGGGPKNSVAQTSGACTVAGPIRMITADTDGQQLRHAFVPTQVCASGSQRAGFMFAKLSDGPVVLTELSGNGGYSPTGVFLGSSDCSQICNPAAGTSDQIWPPQSSGGASTPPIAASGLRVWVPAGSTACALLLAGSQAGWSGFIPY